MSSLVISLARHRSAARFVSFSLVLGLLAACTSKDSSATRKVENAQTWAPDKLTSVQGVPATEIEAQIQKKLEGPNKEVVDAVQVLRRIAGS